MCGLRVDRSFGPTVNAPMVQVFGQAVAVLWVVTDDVLPFIAGVAGDGVAVVLVEAAYAVYLTVILFLVIVWILVGSVVRCMVWRRAGDAPDVRLGFLTVGSGGPEEVCHAITSAIKVVVCGDGFR